MNEVFTKRLCVEAKKSRWETSCQQLWIQHWLHSTWWPGRGMCKLKNKNVWVVHVFIWEKSRRGSLSAQGSPSEALAASEWSWQGFPKIRSLNLQWCHCLLREQQKRTYSCRSLVPCWHTNCLKRLKFHTKSPRSTLRAARHMWIRCCTVSSSAAVAASADGSRQWWYEAKLLF